MNFINAVSSDVQSKVLQKVLILSSKPISTRQLIMSLSYYGTQAHPEQLYWEINSDYCLNRA